MIVEVLAASAGTIDGLAETVMVQLDVIVVDASEPP